MKFSKHFFPLSLQGILYLYGDSAVTIVPALDILEGLGMSLINIFISDIPSPSSMSRAGTIVTAESPYK